MTRRDIDFIEMPCGLLSILDPNEFLLICYLSGKDSNPWRSERSDALTCVATETEGEIQMTRYKIRKTLKRLMEKKFLSNKGKGTYRRIFVIEYAKILDKLNTFHIPDIAS